MPRNFNNLTTTIELNGSKFEIGYDIEFYGPKEIDVTIFRIECYKGHAPINAEVLWEAQRGAYKDAERFVSEFFIGN